MVTFLRRLTVVAAAAIAIGGRAEASSPCSAEKIQEVRRPAETRVQEARIDCRLSLRPSDLITKRLIFEGSGASGAELACNGATLQGGGQQPSLEIRSTRYRDARSGEFRWQPPQAITVRDCRILGSVHIWGMAVNGQGPDLKASSRLPGHSERARRNAPSDILLDRLTITARGNIPLYLGPGVNRVRLANSELKGTSNSVAVYLDAESTGNVLYRNSIHTDTARELVALDGSSGNRILDNRFSSLAHGGIYLYRNCGEGGTIRHATPSDNLIINNVFFYQNYRGSNPAVFLGSRDGQRNYCAADRGYPFGSSISDLDYASGNVVMQNRIFRRQVAEMIRTGDSRVNRPNYIGENETVSEAPDRPAGCFVAARARRPFIVHGETVAPEQSFGHHPCPAGLLRCRDGELVCTGRPSP